MERMVVAYEGRWTRDGRMIATGALAFKDEVPVTMLLGPEGQAQRTVVGRADNFERVGEAIYADVHLDIDMECRVTPDVMIHQSIMVEREEGPGLIVDAATLFSLHVTDDEFFPWDEG